MHDPVLYLWFAAVRGVLYMIEFKDFSFCYDRSSQPVLSDISFVINRGECVLIHGPSGCGKSTLCMTLNGIIPTILRGETGGDIIIAGRSIKGMETRKLATQVGLVFQNPDNQLFAITVEEDVAFGPENLALSSAHIQIRVDEALRHTGLEEIRVRQIHLLSGGQKQRTAIAGLCAMKPDILVLDEPTADLDPQGTRDVIRLLNQLNKEEGKTVIVIEHKIREILPIVDRVITLRKGKVIDNCPRQEFDPATIWPGFPARVHRHEGTHKTILDLQEISYTYPDGTRALNGITFSVSSAECVAFIGDNGSGKTTLTKIIKGLISPSSGTVTLYDHTTGAVVPDRSKKIGYLFQNPDHQIVTNRVDREIAIGLQGMPADKIKQRTNRALELVHLLHYKGCDPCTLSRGERQRLAVASILAMDPEIVICDEPTTGQDYEHLLLLMEYLEQMRLQSKTVILVTHDHELANNYADRIITMNNGTITGLEKRI